MGVQKNQGFTLIEIMIVVAILGILAGIAWVNYSDNVMQSNRSDAHATLNDVAQRLQRCYTTHASYTDDDCEVYGELDDDGTIESPEGFYEITIDNDTDTTYTLEANAIRAPQTNDEDCIDNASGDDNAMTLTHTGARAPEECW